MTNVRDSLCNPLGLYNPLDLCIPDSLEVACPDNPSWDPWIQLTGIRVVLQDICDLPETIHSVDPPN